MRCSAEVKKLKEKKTFFLRRKKSRPRCDLDEVKIIFWSEKNATKSLNFFARAARSGFKNKFGFNTMKT